MNDGFNAPEDALRTAVLSNYATLELPQQFLPTQKEQGNGQHYKVPQPSFINQDPRYI